jgi:hypothetical protein
MWRQVRARDLCPAQPTGRRAPRDIVGDQARQASPCHEPVWKLAVLRGRFDSDVVLLRDGEAGRQ